MWGDRITRAVVVGVVLVALLAGCTSVESESTESRFENITVDETEERTIHRASWLTVFFQEDRYENSGRVYYTGARITSAPRHIDEVPDAYEAANCLNNVQDEAQAHIESVLPEGSEVTVVYEEGVGRHYGYRYAYLYPEGANESLNRQLVEAGYATVREDQEFDLRPEFEAAEQRAKENDRGIWRCRGKTGRFTLGGESSGGSVGDKDCSDFDSQAEAQAHHESDGTDGLDADGDGIACETLP